MLGINTKHCHDNKHTVKKKKSTLFYWQHHYKPLTNDCIPRRQSVCPRLCPHSLAQMASVLTLCLCQSSGGDSLAFMTEKSDSQSLLSRCTCCPQSDISDREASQVPYTYTRCQHGKHDSVSDGLTRWPVMMLTDSAQPED